MFFFIFLICWETQFQLSQHFWSRELSFSSLKKVWHLVLASILPTSLCLKDKIPADKFWPLHIISLLYLGVPLSEMKAIIVNTTRSGNKLENLPAKANVITPNIYEPTFSIKAHFLIWSYQACNSNDKTWMATNIKPGWSTLEKPFTPPRMTRISGLKS